MPNCPTCRDKFDTVNGMKTHHALVHGESIQGVEVECSNCGATLRRKPYLIEEQSDFFCDHSCYGEYMRGRKTGEDNPNYNSQIVNCDQCGAELERPKSRVENQDKHFCDFDCRGKWRSENWSGEDSPFYGHIAVNCEQCNDEYEIQPYKVSAGWGNFCSNSCQNKWMTENLRGEGNTRWSGGWEKYYGANWREKRQERVELDDHECQVCGVHDDDTPHRLEVHHIQPIRTFENPEDANTMENLITLCRPCHARWEGIPLKPEVSNP